VLQLTVRSDGECDPQDVGHPLLKYTIQRLTQAVPTFLLAMAVVFFALRLVPGDQLTQLIGEQVVGTADREALKRELGLDKALPVQYWDFISGLVRGDLGEGTFDNEPVRSKVWKRLPVTLELTLLAAVMAIAIGVPVGIVSAVKRSSPIDYLLRLVGILALSVPTFWLGTMVLVTLALYFNWVPTVRHTPFTEDPWANLQQFLLPSLILGSVLAGSIMRMTRSMMLEVLREDYIRVARAKGLRNTAVIMRHAVRNALIPVITIIGLQVAALLSGTVIIESIFGLPGLGTLLTSSLDRRDFAVIQGINVVVVTCVIIVNLVVDISYVYIDPRLRAF
jgi:peptide/nickel transport system permease protein